MNKSEKIWVFFMMIFMCSVIFYLGYQTGKGGVKRSYPVVVQECLDIKNAYVVVDNEYGMRCFKPSVVVPLQ